MKNLSPEEVALLCLDSLENARPYLSLDVMIAFKELVVDESYRNPERAIEMAETALTTAALLDDTVATGWAIWAKAIALVFAQRPLPALSFYREAETTFSQHNEALPLIKLQAGLVYVLTRCGQLEEALAVADEARPRCHSLGEAGLKIVGQLETNVGILYRHQGKFDLALEAYGRAIEAYTEIGEEIEVARTQINCANAYQEMDHYSQAEALYHQAYQLLERVAPERQELPNIDLNLGLLAEKLGDYQKALYHLEKARATLIPDTYIALVDMIRAEIYNVLNLSQEALLLAQAATQFYAQEKIPNELAQALHAQAIAWKGLGNLEKAESCLLEAREYFVTYTSHRHVALIDLARAEIALEHDRIDQARQIITGLADMIDGDLWPNLAGETCLFQARILLQTRQQDGLPTQANLQNASIALQQAIHFTKQHPQPKLMVGIYHLLSQLYTIQGKSQAAWSALSQSIAYLEAMRANLLLDELQMGLMDEQHRVYLDGLKLLQNQRLFGVSPDTESQWRAMFYLLNMAATAPLAQTYREAEPDSDLNRQLQELRALWHWQQSKLDDISTQMQTDQDISEETFRQNSAEIRAAFRQTESQIADLGRRLHIQSTWHVETTPPLIEESLIDFDDISDETAVNFFQDQATQFCAELQQQLATHEVLLHYFIQDEQIQLLMMDRTEICYYALGSVGLTQQFQRQWQHHLRGVRLIVNNPQTSTQIAQRLLFALGQHLIEPILERLAGYTHLYLVYPPEWREIPFAALRTAGGYLVEQFQLTHLSTPEALLHHTCAHSHQQPASTEPNQRPSALILGYSEAGELPHNLHEARHIEQTLARSGWQTTLLLEEDATLHRLYTATAQSQLLHLATHAFFKPENPLFSWARLADGQLTVADIYHQTPLLNQAVVVLSACETGRGQVRGGGLLGMARALLVSGAKSLVVSLWRVEDQATAKLMAHFYEQIDGSHESISSADLCQAQRLLATTQHPFFWAGFIYIGG